MFHGAAEDLGEEVVPIFSLEDADADQIVFTHDIFSVDATRDPAVDDPGCGLGAFDPHPRDVLRERNQCDRLGRSVETISQPQVVDVSRSAACEIAAVSTRKLGERGSFSQRWQRLRTPVGIREGEHFDLDPAREGILGRKLRTARAAEHAGECKRGNPSPSRNDLSSFSHRPVQSAIRADDLTQTGCSISAMRR